VSLEAESIRDEKVKLLKSIRRLDPSQVGARRARTVQRGGSGRPESRRLPAGTKVKPGSNVEHSWPPDSWWITGGGLECPSICGPARSSPERQ